jgi:hypothetical protein
LTKAGQGLKNYVVCPARKEEREREREHKAWGNYFVIFDLFIS